MSIGVDHMKILLRVFLVSVAAAACAATGAVAHEFKVGAIDIDGDGKADYAVTYGCNAWGDGQCQSHGAFFLARTGAIWTELQ